MHITMFISGNADSPPHEWWNVIELYSTFKLDSESSTIYTPLVWNHREFEVVALAQSRLREDHLINALIIHTRVGVNSNELNPMHTVGCRKAVLVGKVIPALGFAVTQKSQNFRIH